MHRSASDSRRSSHTKFGLTLGLAIGLSSALAAADTLDDQLGPRALAMGDSLRGDSHGALAISLNPSGLPGNDELVFEGSYGYRFTDGASSVTASGCDSTGIVPGCFYYRYLGASPELGGTEFNRRAHEGGAALALRISPKLFVGTNIRYFDYNSSVVDGGVAEGDSNGFTFDLGVTLVPLRQVRVGVVSNHLFGASSPQYPRTLGAGVVVAPLDFLRIAADAVWRLQRPEGESTGRYGGGVELFLSSADKQSGFPLRIGAVHDVKPDGGTYITGGVGFMSGKIAADVGLRRQVSGGSETVLQASLRVYGPRRIPGTRAYR